jgi:hypothetical protein
MRRAREGSFGLLQGHEGYPRDGIHLWAWITRRSGEVDSHAAAACPTGAYHAIERPRQAQSGEPGGERGVRSS